MGQRPTPPVAPFLGAAALVVVFLVGALPAPLFQRPVSLVLDDSQGRLLGATIAADGQWRLGTTGPLPRAYVRALVSFEDGRFASHQGFDLLAFGRALSQNIAAGRVVSGGSTLSMQVIRLSRGGRERSWTEKVVEAVGALLLELRYSKADIVRLYADNAPFGGNVVGVEAAAWRYFGHSAQDLSWAEGALLAVLPNNPSALRPDRNPEGLLAKRNRLLVALSNQGEITHETLEAALAEPLPQAPRPLPQAVPHLLARAAGEGLVGRVTTSLSGAVQDEIRRIAQRHASWLSGNSVHNLGVLVVETQTARVVAYLGNVEGATSGGGNDMVRAPRSTGSLLKPLLYARMLETGELLPGQLVEDVPTRIGGFIPRNNVNTYSGALPASEALARSLNIPAVRELQSYGVARFAADLKDYGLTNLWRRAEDYGLPLVLGGAEATLWDLAGAYSGLGRRALGADFGPPWAWGQPVVTPGPVVSPGAAWLTLDAMKEVVRPGEEAGWRAFAGARRVAWKTGTSHSYKDAWAIGVTPEYTVAVWVGNADGVGRPELLGFSAAAPVLFEVFNSLPPTTWFPQPWDSLQAVEVCADSGFLAGPDCERTSLVWIPRNAVPRLLCPYHRTLFLDSTGRWQVDSRVEAVDRIQKVRWFVLPPQVATYYRQGHWDYRVPPPVHPRIAALSAPLFTVVSPAEGTRLIVPVELDGKAGQFIAQAHHQNRRSDLHWSLDGEYLATTTGEHQLALRPGTGAHRLEVIDDSGTSVVRRFVIAPDSVSEQPHSRRP